MFIWAMQGDNEVEAYALLLSNSIKGYIWTFPVSVCF